MNWNKNLMEKYFLEKLPEKIHEPQCLELLLVVTEEKPGALVMGPDSKDKELLEEFCNEFDLKYIHAGGEERSFFDRLLGRDTRFLKGGFFIARDPEKLEKLQNSSGRFYGFSDEAVGEFLGYPEEAVEYFIKRKDENSTKIRTENIFEKLVEEDKLDKDDSRFLKLISFVPQPTKDCVIKAVEEGKRRREALLDLDEQLGTEIGEKYLEEILRPTQASDYSSSSKHKT